MQGILQSCTDNYLQYLAFPCFVCIYIVYIDIAPFVIYICIINHK